MGRISSIFDRWLGRASGAATFWPLLPAGLVGVVTGALSSGLDWVNQYGAFGWWTAGLLGFLLASLVLVAASVAREKFAMAQAMKKWARDVDQVNPLSQTFDSRRIKLSDIAHPLRRRISNKRFQNCDLLGPANIVLAGGSVTEAGFLSCDFVIVREDTRVYNTIVLETCSITGGTISQCTIFMSQQDYDRIKQPGMNLITYEAPHGRN